MKQNYTTPLVEVNQLCVETGFLTVSNLNIQGTTQDGMFWDDSDDL